MWPFDRTSTRSYVRVGRQAVELWRGSKEGLSLQGQRQFEQGRPPTGAELEVALRELFGSTGPAVTTLIESVWAPVVLVDTGTGLLRRAQLTELVRHRFRLTYDRIDDPVAAWSVRVDHRAGDRHALGFALSPQVSSAIVTAASAAGVKLDGISPAFDWGWQFLSPSKRGLQQGGWWVWPEQDRMLLARVDAGRVIGLHPALDPTSDSTQILRDVEAEAIRQGVARAAEVIVAARWSAAGAAGRHHDGVSWVDLGARGPVGVAPQGKALAGAAG